MWKRQVVTSTWRWKDVLTATVIAGFGMRGIVGLLELEGKTHSHCKRQRRIFYHVDILDVLFWAWLIECLMQNPSALVFESISEKDVSFIFLCFPTSFVSQHRFSKKHNWDHLFTYVQISSYICELPGLWLWEDTCRVFTCMLGLQRALFSKWIL